MIKELEQDGKDDASNKADCESDRENDTKEAAGFSRDIDELSDDISKLEGEIKEINKEVEEAEKIRRDQNTEWKQNDKDDTAAIGLLEKAAGILKDHYAKNFGLIQKSSAKRDAPEVKAGEAPPPPPPADFADYG